MATTPRGSSEASTNAGGLDRDVGARADGDSNVRLGEGMRAAHTL
jgi:hypothetical protein